MKVSVYRILFFLLAIMPFTPKVELIDGVKILPQDLIFFPLAIYILFYSRHNIKFPSYTKPYWYLFIALILLLVSTLYSLTKFLDVIGLIKTLKYIFYTILLILISKYHFNDFVKTFNKIALITISATLILYIIDLIAFPGNVKEFLNASVWVNRLIPTGFYNYIFSIPKMSFYETGGNHGIYGSYLVLVFIINYPIHIQNEKKITNNALLLLLSLVNILILTSRETLLLLVILFISLALKDIVRLKIKKVYLYFFLLVLVSVFSLIYLDINIGIINKVTHTFNSIEKTGTEGNIHARFILWTIILNSIFINPLYFLIGTGYNYMNYQQMLTETVSYLGLSLSFDNWETTENFFLSFLVFGGIVSFFVSLLFWRGLLIKLKSIVKYSLTHYMFLFFTIGLIFTNNTGGSMLSDMFMIQYGLVYIWLVKSADKQNNYNAG